MSDEEENILKFALSIRMFSPRIEMYNQVSYSDAVFSCLLIVFAIVAFVKLEHPNDGGYCRLGEKKLIFCMSRYRDGGFQNVSLFW